MVPSNKEGGGEVEVRGGGRTSCTLPVDMATVVTRTWHDFVTELNRRRR